MQYTNLRALSMSRNIQLNAIPRIDKYIQFTIHINKTQGKHFDTKRNNGNATEQYGSESMATIQSSTQKAK